MDQAMTAQNQYIDAMMSALMERMDFLEKRVAELEQAKKQPAEVEAVLTLNEKSAKNVRQKIINFLRW